MVACKRALGSGALLYSIYFMPDINDLHKFYEANLPEYDRADISDVNKFFLDQMGFNTKKPIKVILNNLQQFKRYVCNTWQGQPIFPDMIEKPVSYGFCSCGGAMIRRQNKQKGNYFLGCSNFPGCRNTQPLDE